MANLGEAIQGFQGGYDWADRVFQTRKERAEQERGTAAKRALAEAMASGPPQTGAIPSAPAEAAPTPAFAEAIPTDGGVPATSVEGPATLVEPPTAGPNDPDVNQFESEVAANTGRPVALRKDWDAFREQLLQSAAALGDPNTVAMVDEYVSGLQAKGFKQNASRAAVAASMGDQAGAAHFLTKAWGYMEDGNTPRIQPVKDGNFVFMPVDEDTGKPSDSPMVLSPTAIGHMVKMAEDPAEFAKWKEEFEQDAENDRINAQQETRKADIAEGRLAAEEGRLEVSKEELKLKKQTAADKAAVAKAKKDGEWNDAATRALTNDVARAVGTRREGSDMLYDLYEQYGNDIQSDAINIAKHTKDYNLPDILGRVERAVQNGDTFEFDPATQSLIIVTPDGVEIAYEDY